MDSSPPCAVGIGVLGLGLAGYAIGVTAAYPGRAFALAGVMAGVTLVAIECGRAAGEGGENTPNSGATGGTLAAGAGRDTVADWETAEDRE